MHYFDIEPDWGNKSAHRARCLGFIKLVNGEYLPGNAFSSGERLDGKMKVEVAISSPGISLDYEQATPGVPILSQRLCEILHGVCDDQVEFVPIEIAGDSSLRFVLNTLYVIRCIDEIKSSVRYCGEEQKLIDPNRRIESIWNMHLLREPIAQLHIFRPADWEVALIVSDVLRQAILDAGDITGIHFVPMNLS